MRTMDMEMTTQRNILLERLQFIFSFFIIIIFSCQKVHYTQLSVVILRSYAVFQFLGTKKVMLMQKDGYYFEKYLSKKNNFRSKNVYTSVMVI